MTPIEDYGFLSDTQSGALVSRDGCVDWMCLPRFDSPACFASLLGEPANGHWRFAPEEEVVSSARRYRGDTMILETDLETERGAVQLIDFMPPRGDNPDIIRIVCGRRGTVRMHMELIIRFDYGRSVPWVRKRDRALEAIAGPDGLMLRTPVQTRGKDLTTVAEFEVKEGDRVPFVLTWFPSHAAQPKAVRAENALRETEKFWTEWAQRCSHAGPWSDAVKRSLLTLKGLTYAPTGGIVAAATTSLPEEIGGVRNWDYRYCWLRDATFTLMALMQEGYLDEAKAWRDWLLRAIAGSAEQMQIMYGVQGERRLVEMELPWLSGYENSRPVRIGNGASGQFQIDVWGEVMDAMYQAHCRGIENRGADWHLQAALLRSLESRWTEPDEGIWEVRGGRQHFTHSKLMAWVAFDRGIRMVQECGCSAGEHVQRWREIRQRIHDEVCSRGFNKIKGAFTQVYDGNALDASLLVMPMVGFLPPTDPRVVATVEAIEKELMWDGFVMRYRPEETKDGLTGGEGVFLPCSFWMADCLHLCGRHEEARQLFERLLALRNDLGLLAEEYDPRAKRQLGNYPQAFTHVALVHTAWLLSKEEAPAAERAT